MKMGGAHEITLVIAFENPDIFGKANSYKGKKYKRPKGQWPCAEF